MQKKTQRFDARQNMCGDTYEVFHYLDIKTRHMEAHYHDFYEIFLFLKGDVDYWIEGSLYHLKPGDILLVNPSELHRPIPLNETEDYERIVVWIDRKFLNSIDKGIFEKCFDSNLATWRKVIRPSSAEKSAIQNTAISLVQEFYNDDFASKSCSFGLLLQFLSNVNRLALSGEAFQNEKYRTPTFIADILSYISEHYSEDLSLDRLSNHFFVSKYYLSHEFKKAVGTSVHRYITLKRLSFAHELLSNGTAPSEAGILCGFGDYTTFFRAFKSEYEISPSECYKNH